eukprot:ctg_2363.g531
MHHPLRALAADVAAAPDLSSASRVSLPTWVASGGAEDVAKFLGAVPVAGAVLGKGDSAEVIVAEHIGAMWR